jgi:hypothetical protein
MCVGMAGIADLLSELEQGLEEKYAGKGCRKTKVSH